MSIDMRTALVLLLVLAGLVTANWLLWGGGRSERRRDRRGEDSPE